MKKLLLLLLVSSICLWGCLNSEEDVTINADGSGVYQNTMDMSGMFDMMDMLAAMDTSQNSQLKKVSDKDIDSSFSFKSFIDTVTSLTADEKRLFEKATMRMNINQKQKKFKMTMSYPLHKPSPAMRVSSICFLKLSFSESFTTATPPWAYLVLVSSAAALVTMVIFLSGNFSDTFSAYTNPAIPEPITKKSVCIVYYDS